jgi:hypothetical protein
MTHNSYYHASPTVRCWRDTLRQIVCLSAALIACLALMGFGRFDTVPNAPSGLAGAATSAGVVNLTWTDNSDNDTMF